MEDILRIGYIKKYINDRGLDIFQLYDFKNTFIFNKRGCVIDFK